MRSLPWFEEPSRRAFSRFSGSAAQYQHQVAKLCIHLQRVSHCVGHSRAEQLSAQHTGKTGRRAFDILHVATALELEAKQFLTFDGGQSALAKAVGLKVKP